MTDYTELVKALRWCAKPIPCSKTECPRKNTDEDCACHVLQDAADAIEEMAKHITEMHERVTVLQIDRGQLEAEVKRLKECNDELREKQTFIDHWGTRWGTSAKDVPDSAYKHGYADGKYEALTLEECIDRLHELGWLQEHDRILSQPHWVSLEERLPNVDEKVLVFAIGKLDGFIGDTVIALTSMSDTNWLNHHEKVDKPYWLDPWQYFLTDYRITHWMPLPEPPKEDA